MEAILLLFGQMSKTKVWDHIPAPSPQCCCHPVTGMRTTMVNVNVGWEYASEQRLPEEDLPYPPQPCPVYSNEPGYLAPKPTAN